jgi:hypothetical protein
VVRFRSRVLSHETKRGTKIKTYSLHVTAPLQKHFVGQPLDLFHHKNTIVVVTFVGLSGLPFRLVQSYPQKKQPEHYAAQLSVATYQTIQSGCLFKVVRRDQIDIQGVRAYY